MQTNEITVDVSLPALSFAETACGNYFYNAGDKLSGFDKGQIMALVATAYEAGRQMEKACK